MTGRVVNLPRVRAALARLDAVVAAYPELCGDSARTRLHTFVTEHQIAQRAHSRARDPEHQVGLAALGEVAPAPANDRR